MHWLITDASCIFSAKGPLFSLKPHSTAHKLCNKVKTMIQIFLNNPKCFCPFQICTHEVISQIFNELVLGELFFVCWLIGQIFWKQKHPWQMCYFRRIRSTQNNFWQSETNHISATFFLKPCWQEIYWLHF